MTFIFAKNKENKLQRAFYHLLALASMALLLVFSTSCEKETTSGPEETLSEEEVVAVVEGALLMNTEGITAEALDAANTSDEYLEKNNGPCEASFDTSVVRSYSGARISSAYTSHWGWTVHCNDLMVPNSIDFGRTTVGIYETLRMSSNDQANSNWAVDNLIAGDNYIINGSYTREGSQTSKVRSQNSFSSSLFVELSDLQVHKELKRIESGTATYALSGESTNGNSFHYEGQIIFLGDGSATVTINGNTYEIDLFE